MMKMIDHVCAATVEYIDHMPKSKRKKYGQFFTSKETAVFMAGLFRFLKVTLLSTSSIRVLAQEFFRLHSLNDWSQILRLTP